MTQRPDNMKQPLALERSGWQPEVFLIIALIFD